MINQKIWIGIVTLLLATQAYAGEIKVSDAWARATVPGQEVGMVGMVIVSQQEASLLSVTSPVAASAEIHTMTMDDGVMQMRQLKDLPLPAKQAVTLGMEGNHLMLIDLRHALKSGEKVPLTLTVQFADKSTKKIKVDALVRSLSAEHGENNHN